jgi:hypothetical protein
MKSKGVVAVGILASVCFILAGFSPCPAQEKDKISQKEWSKIIESKVAEQMGDTGIINYEDGYVEAVGIGAVDPAAVKGSNARPMCLRAATVVAYRNLLEITKGVRVDSHTTVSDFVTESDVINAAVSGFVKGARSVNTDYLSDGTCEVTLRMSLTGKFTQTILTKAIQQEQKRDLPPPSKPAPLPAGTPVYTGIVVDARGLGASPAVFPKIIDETGAEVYGPAVADKTFAMHQGICGYTGDPAAARDNQRVSGNPLTVKGMSAEGAGKSDIRISNDDARQIRSAEESLGFMKKCRVMIVLD